MRVIVRYDTSLPGEPRIGAGSPSPPHKAGVGTKVSEAVVVITLGRESTAGEPAGLPPGKQRALEAASQAMRLRDAEVRGHEAAHLAVLGAYAAGPITYGYATGPNGQQYAVSGSIKVDLSPVPGNPEATLRKARAIMEAALAPGEPSGPDMRVAAQAYMLEVQAQRELAARRAPA